MDGWTLLWAVLVFAGMSLVGRYAQRRRQRRGGDKLAILARRLGGTVDEATRSAAGLYRDIAIRHRLRSTGAGEWERTWTEIECQPTLIVAIYVRRHGAAEGRRIASGGERDFKLGDRRFDAMFRVDAAPGELVRRAFGPRVRAFFLAHPDAALETDDDVLRLTLPRWITGYADAIAAWNALVGIVHGVNDAAAAIDRARRDAGAGPYRTDPDAAARALGSDRTEEVAELKQRRAKRLAARGSR